jgi:ADP-ribosylglycohydrolase
MRPIRLAEGVYRDRVYGCWLGKNIGGTLGTPHEGDKSIHSLTFYDPVPTEPLPNDDLDLQLVWLKMLQERGVHLSVSDFADYWVKHLGPYPWNEYGFCRQNLDRGLRPPISGCYDNYYIDEMGSPIRSEIWACVAPGDPGLAASLAWNDAVLDHAGGEGMYGEMFWAALESAAFVVSDPDTLIRIGLAMIPLHSQISRVVRDVVWCRDNGVEWAEVRERILQNFGHYQPCSAAQNHGFTVLGWLYGEDFGDCLCKAVNCGYDTDCSGATLGAVLGIIGGAGAIPARWREPIGEGIVLHKFTESLDAPQDLEELTQQTVEIGRQMLQECSEVATIADESCLPDDLLSSLFDNSRALLALDQDPQSAITAVDGYQVALHYGGEPVLHPGIARTVGVSVRRDGQIVEAEVALQAPEGWTVEPAEEMLGRKQFALRAHTVADENRLVARVTVDGHQLQADYLMLGPGAAPGFPCGVNVPRCPECHARLQSCICVTG